jgi:hypothetical protein
MFAALFLAPKLFHLHGEPNFPRWATEVGDFFKVVSQLQENCKSAAFWADFNHVRFPWPWQRAQRERLPPLPGKLWLEGRKSIIAFTFLPPPRLPRACLLLIRTLARKNVLVFFLQSVHPEGTLWIHLWEWGLISFTG